MVRCGEREDTQQEDGVSGQALFFDITDARELRRRYRHLNPGARVMVMRSWRESEHHAQPGLMSRLGDLLWAGSDRSAVAGLWFWSNGEEELRAQGRDVLLKFVHPLVASGRQFCVGFPFPADVVAPAALTLAARDRLDLEDIGLLLGGNACGTTIAAVQRRSPTLAHTSLDVAQRAAAHHGSGAARVLAPAGAGKTKTLVARVTELVARGVDPAQILLLAFNTKAAEQLEERLEARGIPCTRRIDVHGCTSAVHCATFNAFGARYQREVAGQRIAVDAGGRSQRMMMRQAMDDAGFPMASLKPARGSDPIGALLAPLSRVRAGLEAPNGIAVDILSTGEPAVVTVPFGPVHQAYARLQAAHRRQSFDDQIYFTVVDLLAAPSRRRLMQQRYSHVLVDEFQDLNPAQLALVDIVSRPRRNLFAVGDDDQLIYGWRFADPDGILRFHDRVPPAPHSATYTLTTNYRCSHRVVQAAGSLIARNERREAKPMAARPGAPAGAVLFAGAPTWSERGAEICAFLSAERSRLACQWRDLAVLSRFRSQQFAVALALDAAGVPRTPHLGYRLFTHPAARLTRSCLALASLTERVAGDDARRVLANLVPRMSAAQLDAVGTAVRPWEQLLRLASTESQPAAMLVGSICERAQTLHAWFGPAPEPSEAQPPATAQGLLTSVIEDFSLEAAWQLIVQPEKLDSPDTVDPSRHSADDGGPGQVLDGLLALAEAYPRPETFLASWDRLATREAAGLRRAPVSPERGTDMSAESHSDCVALCTIHAAKGREYRSVVIPDYFCDISRWSPDAVEEERRVVYVGVTRACERLLITVDTARPIHPFLRELVDPPTDGEHCALRTRLDERDADERTTLQRRLNELEILFPEQLHPAPRASHDPAS